MSKGNEFSYLVQENRLKIHSSFIIKSFFFPLSLIYFDYKIWKRNWMITTKKQVLLKLIGQYGIQKYFFIRTFNDKNI